MCTRSSPLAAPCPPKVSSSYGGNTLLFFPWPPPAGSSTWTAGHTGDRLDEVLGGNRAREATLGRDGG